jgi:hypothetical protein
MNTFKNYSTIKKGFYLAGISNIIGVLVFSKLFTNSVIPETDPSVMSYFGLLMIIVWGFAYIAVAKNFETLKWLVAVFAIEKFCYGFIWTKWILNNSVSPIFDKDILAGSFYSFYGINDWLFFLFFVYVFFKIKK